MRRTIVVTCGVLAAIPALLALVAVAAMTKGKSG